MAEMTNDDEISIIILSLLIQEFGRLLLRAERDFREILVPFGEGLGYCSRETKP